MIIINSRCDNIALPVVNRCRYDKQAKKYLWLQNTYTKEIFIVRLFNPLFNSTYLGSFIYYYRLDLPDDFLAGEYEYYFTADRPEDYEIDFNNIAEVKSNVFSAGKMLPIIRDGNIIFSTKGTNILETINPIELEKRLNIISSGILKFNIAPHYNEPEQQRRSDYKEYQG